MREEWTTAILEDFLDYIQPKKYIVKSTKYSDNYKTPVLTAGKSFIKGYTNERENIFDDLPAIIFDDFTTATKFVSFKFKVKSSAMKILVPTSGLVNMKYVFYFMQTIRQNTDTHKRYWISIFSQLPIKTSPLPEQRAIVAKIEQLFSELDNGIANLKAAKDKLEIYRQAVLKKAFEGEWETCTVGNKFKFLGGGTPKKSIPEYWNGDIPWCSVKDVKGDFLYKTKDYITELGLKESSTNIAEIGEVILITRISPGKSIITKIRTAINQDLKIVSPIDDYSPKFTHYLFKSIKREMLKKSNGTTVLGINLNNLKDISIPDIPEEDQNHVIEFIESRLSICENVLANIEEGLNKSEALRQSILKQAFEGKLLSEEEVEACRAAPDWEPAEQLLERIKNQKEGTA